MGRVTARQEDVKAGDQPLLASWVSSLAINPGGLPRGGDTRAGLGNPRISSVEFLLAESVSLCEK